jgi:hypothetical protein
LKCWIGISEHINLGIKFDPNTGMDFFSLFYVKEEVEFVKVNIKKVELEISKSFATRC